MRSNRLASVASLLALCVAGISLSRSTRVQEETVHLLSETRTALESFKASYEDQRTNLDIIKARVQQTQEENVRLERQLSLLRDAARGQGARGRNEPPVGPIERAPVERPEQLGGNVELKVGHQRAFLGVAFLPDLGEHWKKEVGYPHEFGLRVSRVVARSPAKKAGLQVNDIIMKINDQVLGDARDIEKLMEQRRPGETIRLALFREGKELEVAVNLEPRR